MSACGAGLPEMTSTLAARVTVACVAGGTGCVSCYVDIISHVVDMMIILGRRIM
jgi:hypothetical protein